MSNLPIILTSSSPPTTHTHTNLHVVFLYLGFLDLLCTLSKLEMLITATVVSYYIYDFSFFWGGGCSYSCLFICYFYLLCYGWNILRVILKISCFYHFLCSMNTSYGSFANKVVHVGLHQILKRPYKTSRATD